MNPFEALLLCLVAFGGSLLTFFSGFGLGTLLMPVLAVFFPIEIAIGSEPRRKAISSFVSESRP